MQERLGQVSNLQTDVWHKPLYISAPPGFLSRRLFLPAALLRTSGSAKNSFRQFAHRRLPKFPGRPPRAFLPAIAVIAEEAGHCISATKKMDLEAVGLFLGAGLRIDAPDVLF
jgi:hypothetical protein